MQRAIATISFAWFMKEFVDCVVEAQCSLGADAFDENLGCLACVQVAENQGHTILEGILFKPLANQIGLCREFFDLDVGVGAGLCIGLGGLGLGIGRDVGLGIGGGVGWGTGIGIAWG